MEKMKAAILKDVRKFAIEEVPMPQITQPDEIIVKVLVASICGTDKGFATNPDSKGYGDMRGRILGHEIVGQIVDIGPEVKNFKIGERIVLNPNSFCNVCPACRAGHPNHCQNMELMGITHPGGFAEYVKTYERLAFPISEKVPLRHAVFAEPLSCAMNGFSRLDITPGDTCVVFGMGPIGLMFAQLARRNGARVVCIEPMPKRIEVAEKLGFTVFNPFVTDTATIKEELIAMWGRRANYVIDAAGGQLPVAVDLAEFCATILCYASPRVVKEANLGPIQNKELKIIGSFVIHDSMPKAITILENNYLDLDPIITHYLPLEEVGKGVEYMISGEGLEIVLNIGADGKEE